MPNEIERRFVLERLPDDLVIHHPYQVVQAYTVIDDVANIEERVRYRRTPEGNYSYLHYQKRGIGRIRKETATPISPDEFRRAMVTCLGLPVIKHVYHEQWGGRWIELHIFRSHRPLMTIEIEFRNEADAASFRPFSWFGREVTDDRRYNSAAVALYGVPGDFKPNDDVARRFHHGPVLVEP